MTKKEMKLAYLLLLGALSFGATSCSDDDDNDENVNTVTFEDLKVDESGYWKGDTTGVSSPGSWGATNYAGQFTTNGATFENTFSKYPTMTSWTGFGYSTLADTSVAGNFDNEMYLYGKSGANNSKTFAIAFSDGATFTFNETVSLKSVQVNNNTYTYKVIRDGNEYSTAFDNGSWFSVTFTGYDANDSEVASKTYYLADFRDGKKYICEKWETVDLSAFDGVKSVKLKFEGSDANEYGLLTPTYVCIDNLQYSVK